MSGASHNVVDIRQHPEHVAAVGAWVHREWWLSRAPLATLTTWVEGCVAAGGFPATLVAVADGRPLGSVFLHATEAPDRPAYTPYLGALYVEPAFRSRGIGRALVRAIERHAAARGFTQLFLNAGPHRVSFYAALGWRVVESDYGPHRLSIMRRECGAEVPAS